VVIGHLPAGLEPEAGPVPAPAAQRKLTINRPSRSRYASDKLVKGQPRSAPERRVCAGNSPGIGVANSEQINHSGSPSELAPDS